MINVMCRLFLLCLVSLSLWDSLTSNSAHALQQATNPTQVQPPQEPQETFRISTVLVQTDVSVFDKQGNFVDGLPREAFELKVDGKPLSIALFQRVTAGSAEEAANLAAARGK